MNRNTAHFQHLHDVAEQIVSAPDSIDATTVAALKSATMKLASQYDDPTHALETLYLGDSELSKDLRKAFAIVGKDDGDDDDGGGSSDDAGSLADHPIVQIARLLVASGHKADIASALDHLLNTSAGAALLHRTSTHKGKDSPPMQDSLTAIMKDLGPIGVAKQIVAEGRAYGISESEFVAAATEHAAKQHPELRPDSAFAKLYEREESVRRACSVLKSAPLVADLTPLQVGGAAAQATDDPAEAVEQLKQLGAQRYPSASPSTQFERALVDPANHKLARRAVPIPRATTSYPFPR
jgi:hypothetical protein